MPAILNLLSTLLVWIVGGLLVELYRTTVLLSV
jgi:hypothetical protein